MRRRQFLAAGLSVSALAGCLGIGDSGPSTTTAPPSTSEPNRTTTQADQDDRGVYIQSFEESMAMQGTAERGEYAFALMYAVPHTFWTVTLDSVETVPRTDDDTLHLMSVVWDPETETVLPDVGLSVEIARDNELVSQEQIYPMLSQPMGFHYGGNFTLPSDATYTATLSVSGVTARRTGSFQDRFGSSASAAIELVLDDDAREQISTTPIEQAGDPGALAPMEMPFPQAIAPPADELPDRVLADPASLPSSDGALFAPFIVETPPAGVQADSGDSYLAVSARTPYNRLVLPSMTLEATLTRGGDPVFDGELARTLDPDLGYHYGAAVPGVESGDVLELRVATPPQVARHEGYERAFLSMPPMELTV